MSTQNIVSKGFSVGAYAVVFLTHRGDQRTYFYATEDGILIEGGADPANFTPIAGPNSGGGAVADTEAEAETAEAEAIDPFLFLE